MSVIKFKRFTRLQTLQRIGRPLLVRFFERFHSELTGQKLSLPDPDAPEAEWFRSVTGLLASPEVLPDRLTEALYAIDEMASPDGHERLEKAAAEAQLPIEFQANSSRADIALQVWLAAPELLARIHNQHRLRRLTAFEYFGTAVPPAERPPVPTPDQTTLRHLNDVLDPWFTRHQRGRNTSRIEFYRLQTSTDSEPSLEEFWFLVRHGDPFTRAPKVDEQKTEIIHFRPERDDVVVFSPARDEIRINCRTRGERDLYVRSFGLCLRGSAGLLLGPQHLHSGTFAHRGRRLPPNRRYTRSGENHFAANPSGHRMRKACPHAGR
jgi:hypothetical protein